MSQDVMPFFDTAEDATRHAIEASGKSLKEVGTALWPDKSAEAARTGLANALNEHRPERLTADQHLFVANFVGRFEWLYYCAMKCGHSRPERISPEARAAKIQQQIFGQARELKQLLSQLESLNMDVRAA